MCPTSDQRPQDGFANRSTILRALAAALVVAEVLATQIGSAFVEDAWSSTTKTIYGSVSGLRLRNAQGHPCVDYRSITRKEIVMEKTSDHIVVVTNACAKAIDVKLCYRKSQTGCKIIRVSAFDKGSAMLGSMYDTPVFAFDYEETFVQ